MNNDLEQFSEERLKELAEMCESKALGFPASHAESAALARIALSLKRGEHGAEMVTRRSFDKASSEARTWRERAMKAESEIASTITCYSCRKVMTRDQHAEADGFCPHCDVEIELDDDDTYTTPQPAHTEQSEMLNKARSLSESIGELRKQIYSSGGYDFEDLRSERVNSPAIPDGWLAIPKDMLADYRDVKSAEVQAYKTSFGSHCDIPNSRWQRDLADLTEELAEIDKLIAAAPKPESE